MTTGAPAPRHRAPRWFWLIALLPPLWSAPGRVAADTKTYLSLDPGGLMRQAPSLWESDTGLGTVTHQTIGYLFPQGPWWWLADLVGVPDWITQRLWWSTIVAVALFGTHRLARRTGATPAAATVAALAYGFGPYLFAYVSRISAILLPWAVLPWMVLALRAGLANPRGWRQPARFALLVLVAGTVNATSIAFAVLGAVVWLVAEAGSVRRALPVVWRSAVATAAVSVWWLVALWVQGSHGIEILRFTETYETIRRTALPSEFLRGFGYWFSYGGDWLDPWVGATHGLVAQPWYLALGLALAVGSLIGLTRVTGAARRPAAAVVVAGLALAVGEAWTGAWSPWGQAFGALVDAGPGMALRSTQRAVPVLALGLAIGLGALADAPGPTGRRLGRGPVLVAALGLQAAPWFVGGIATDAITRGAVPGYWSELAAGLGDRVDHRVWETPGSDFASYRWGGTIDPVLVGLTERPVVARELIPLGTDGAADLVSEIERRVAENTLDPAAIAALARLMAVDTIVARNDLEFERYALARPDDVTARLDAAGGVSRVSAGPDTRPDRALIDEQTYGGEPGIGTVPAVAVWQVGDPVTVLTVRAGDPVVVHGSAATLVALAEHGLIDGSEVLLDADSASGLPTGAWTVFGDSNRAEDRRWYSIGATIGATRAVGETSDDPALQSLDVIGDPSRATVSELTGGFSAATATSYGSPAILSAEDRPEHAVDGDPFTAWRGAALEGTSGLAIDLRLTAPSSPRWVDLLQPITGERGRWITRIRVATDGPDGPWQTEVDLDDRSRRDQGQRVDLAGDMIERVHIEVIADSSGPLPGYGRSPGVGFAEITLDGVAAATEWIVIADDPRPAGSDGRTTIVLDRRRIDPTTANRFDPEPLIARRFGLATAIDGGTLTGAWKRSAFATDPVVLASSPALVGVTALEWVSRFDPTDAWIEVELDRPATTGGELVVTTATGELFSRVAALAVSDAAGTTLTVPVDPAGRAVVDVDRLDGDRVRIAFVDIEPRTTVDRFSNRSRTLPVGVVSVTPVRTVADRLDDAACHDGLLQIDGTDVAIRLGSDGRFRGCEPTVLAAGSHRVLTTSGHLSGVDLDRIVIDAGSVTTPTTVSDLTFERTDTRVRAELDGGPGGWLVFAESWGPGWTASVDGVDLGTPLLVDGYAMGWPLPDGATGELVIEWTPQRLVRLGLLLGLIAVVAVAALALRRTPDDEPPDDAPPDDAPPDDEGHTAPGPVGGLAAGLLLIVAFGPYALLAPLIAPLTRRGRRWLLAVPVGAMWLWTAGRQVRWELRLDLGWPASMGWAQGVVVAVVAACCWVALTEDRTDADAATRPGSGVGQ
ncbi:MAG TPA: alpha-(1-_3)-arabinofuranosyltransferase family protein [Ilumatobacter sp.]